MEAEDSENSIRNLEAAIRKMDTLLRYPHKTAKQVACLLPLITHTPLEREKWLANIKAELEIREALGLNESRDEKVRQLEQLKKLSRKRRREEMPDEYELVCIICKKEFVGPGHNPHGYRFKGSGFMPFSTYGDRTKRACSACNVKVEKWRGERG